MRKRVLNERQKRRYAISAAHCAQEADRLVNAGKRREALPYQLAAEKFRQVWRSYGGERREPPGY